MIIMTRMSMSFSSYFLLLIPLFFGFKNVLQR